MSINNQVLRGTLQQCFYGFYFLRILQFIVAIHIKWPPKIILIGKIDLDDAYRHIYTNKQIAST